MPPLPVILFVAIMFGYPLIQIAAISLRRPHRLRFNALADEVAADPHYGVVEQGAIAWVRLQSRGRDGSIVLAPLALPIFILKRVLRGQLTAADVPEHERRDDRMETLESACDLPKNSPLWSDERFHRLLSMMISLEMARWPISVFLSFITSAPAALLGIALQIARRSTVSLPRFSVVFARATR